ncbi:CRAL/TRIO domain containing protein [Novymonas esmeraldas]|uniref:CRAL/TRIO domain containing protein n=1 Tax=Novymonas esmeraldas TaxID=1808958 RepID=A0AAW0EY51_9TRYP
MANAPVLLDIGTDAYAHQMEVDEVKRRMGIHHNYFDCWIFGFLENKNFNVDEAIAKLQRRADFEREQLAAYNVTDWMMENMRKGIIQIIGNDKAGRVTLYVSTARDKPVSARREESRMNFDMFVSYGTRLRPESKRCQIAMLINQDKASMMSNLDMTFQADIALRIAKFYPGCVDKMYICKMGRLLAALAKPIFSRLPAIVSDRIIIVSDGDIRAGKLLELYDASVLPVELGGQNDCDHQDNYDRFATNIRDYFEQLKAAVLRGEGVKEWELSNLRASGYAEELSRMDALKRSIIDPSSSLRDQMLTGTHEPGGCSPLGTNGSVTVASFSPRSAARHVVDIDDDANLVTCGTDSVEMNEPQSPALLQLRNSSSAPRTPTRDLFTDYVSQFATIESFFRLSMTEMHEREWLQVVQWEVQERQRLLHDSGLIQGDKLLAGLPPSVLLVAKGFLWLCLMITSFFFFIGTCFIALLGVITLVNIFFAIFVQPYHVFLYGAAFVVVAAQFVIFCSRGFDVARNTFQGRVVQAFKAFGAKALLCQLTIYVGCTIGYFVLFCVMAARYDVLTGLQYSLAYGWIVAVCLIFVYHVVFGFGLRTVNKRSYAHGSRQNNAETTLYLFMDVEMDDEHMEDRCPPAEVMMLTMVGVVSVAMGVAYLTGGGFFFLCAAIVAQAMLLLLSTTFMTARSVSSSSDITICGVFYASMFWMDAIFTMSQNRWDGGWGNSLLTVLFIMLFFVITGMVSVYGPWKGSVRRWLFRLSWVLLLLHLIGCVAALLVFNYRFGLFVLALAVHLLLCVVRTNGASSHYGVFTMSASFTLALLACCILGHSSAVDTYSGVASDVLLPNYARRFRGSSASLSSRSQSTLSRLDALSSAPFPSSSTSSDSGSDEGIGALPPLCLTVFGPTLDLVGMALFTKLGLNEDRAAQDVDLGRWFPSFRRMAVPDVVDANVLRMDAFREETTKVNTTVVAVRPGSDLMLLIESMTMWIDTYALSFFSFLMPAIYVDLLMPYLNFVQQMLPLRWETSIDHTASVVRTLLLNLRGDREVIYLVGHGPIGSRAAVIGLQTQSNVNSVVFSGPPIVQSKYGLNITADVLARRLLSVQTMQTVFSTWYLRTASMQFVPCSLGGTICDRIDTMVQELNHLCTA